MFETCLCLNDSDIAFGIIDFRQQVPFLDPATAVDLQRFDEARHLGIQGRELECPDGPGLARHALHPASLGLDDLHLDQIVFLVPAVVGIRFVAYFWLLVSVGHEPEPTRPANRKHDDDQAQPTPNSRSMRSYTRAVVRITPGDWLVSNCDPVARHATTPKAWKGSLARSASEAL